MSIRDDVAELLRLDARAAALKARQDVLRRSLLDAALTTLEQEGAAPTWRVAGAGSVGLTVRTPKPVVVDSDTLLSWVEERYGDDAVETVRRLRSDWLDGFWAFCSLVEANCSVISEDGEQVPGVVLQSTPPFLTVRLSKEAKLGAAIDLDSSEFLSDMAAGEVAE